MSAALFSTLMPPKRPTPHLAYVPMNDAASAVGAITLAFSADPVAHCCWPDPQRYLKFFPAFVQAFAGRSMALAMTSLADEHRDCVLEMMERMALHHPHGAHWHLPLIGVEPRHQGHGPGSHLMHPMLQRYDEEGLPAYLESTNPRNIPFWERPGFRAIGRVQAGSSPVVVPMLREVRS